MTAESMVCCPLDDGDGERPKFYEVSTPKARKELVCDECRETILKGTTYESVSGKWNDDVSTYRTCPSCVEIRNHFACGNGWTFGEVWEQLEAHFFPDMTAGGPCMEGLSPAAKGRLFERRLKWLEDSA